MMWFKHRFLINPKFINQFIENRENENERVKITPNIDNSRLEELLEKGIYDSELFISRNKILAERRQKLEEGISEAHSFEQSQKDYESRYVALLDAISALENKSLSAEAKNQLLKSVIKDITYSRISTLPKWSHVPFTLDISLL